MEERKPAKKHQIQKRKFSKEEDCIIKRFVEEKGVHCWKTISELLYPRTPRQIRERWKHYLSPRFIPREWTFQEDILLMHKHDEMGAKWTKMSPFFPGRTSINIKNRYALLVRRNEKNSQKTSNDEKKGENTDNEKTAFIKPLDSDQYPKIKAEYRNGSEIVAPNACDTGDIEDVDFFVN